MNEANKVPATAGRPYREDQREEDHMANPMSETSQFLPQEDPRSQDLSEIGDQATYAGFKQGATTFNSAENLHGENAYFTSIKHGDVNEDPASGEASGLRTQRAKEQQEQQDSSLRQGLMTMGEVGVNS